MKHPTLICAICATDRFEPLPVTDHRGELLSSALFVCQECSGVYFAKTKRPEAPKYNAPTLGPPTLSTYGATSPKGKSS